MLDANMSKQLQENILARLDGAYSDTAAPDATKELSIALIPLITVALQEYDKLIFPQQQQP